jgi:hypothetical protein
MTPPWLERLFRRPDCGGKNYKPPFLTDLLELQTAGQVPDLIVKVHFPKDFGASGWAPTAVQ